MSKPPRKPRDPKARDQKAKGPGRKRSAEEQRATEKAKQETERSEAEAARKRVLAAKRGPKKTEEVARQGPRSQQAGGNAGRKDQATRDLKKDAKRDRVADQPAKSDKRQFQQISDSTLTGGKTFGGGKKGPEASDRIVAGTGGRGTVFQPSGPASDQFTAGVPRQLSNVDKKKFAAALAALQNQTYSPRLDLPGTKFEVPQGPHVIRPAQFPAGVLPAKASFDRLDDAVPVLLFPVRLETRFTANGEKLRIRIFPDQASLNGLDPRLTRAEFDAATEFLSDHRRARGAEAKLEVWRAFATAFEPRRAAWMVKAVQSGEAEKSLRQPGDAIQAVAPFLPDHWMVSAYHGSNVIFDEATAPVARDIAFSPDFGATPDIRNDVAIDPAVKWMTDYGEAVAKGMAITVNLPWWARQHVDEIYVIGVRTKDSARSVMSPARAADKLSALFEAHLYDWGGGFVAPGTATNNTSDVESGWSNRELDIDDVYARLIQTQGAPSANEALTASVDETMTPIGVLDAAGDPGATNYHRLQRMLGLPNQSILKGFEGRTGSEDAVQAAMNTLLWPVTFGELFGPLMKGRDSSYLKKEDTDWIRRWFIDNVRGGSNLPTLRLGRTPYGVLPVQKLTSSVALPNMGKDAVRRRNLTTYLRRLLPLWDDATDQVVRMEMSDGTYDEVSDRFLQILRQQPHPANYQMTSAVSERGLFDFRYEIRNLAVHPDHNMDILNRVFARITIDKTADGIRVRQTAYPPGKSAYYDWPNSFVDVEHQIRVLSEKRQLLLDLLDPTTIIYADTTVTILGTRSVSIRQPIVDAMEGRRDDIETLAGFLQEMIDICVERREVNAPFTETVKPPNAFHTGVVGYTSNDATMSYLSFDGAPKTWPVDQHVIARSGHATVGFDRQVDYLLAYAQSFISNADAPAEPTFPGGRRPLLFRLIKEGIFRTGTDEEASNFSVFEMAEVAGAGDISVAERQSGISDIITAMEPGQIASITRGIKSLNKPTGAPRVAKRDEPVARIMKNTSPQTLQTLATTIEREANVKGTAAPVKEMKALSAELRSISKATGGAAKRAVFSAVPNPRRDKITEIKKALTLLRDLNPDQIELLMSQTMGIASWRLDAWMTSLAAHRIGAARAGQGRYGIQIGAFGWVHNLKPNNRLGAGGTDKSGKGKADGNRVTSQGYIHTPSLNHAKTAAVLRAGWTNYGTNEATSPMAVDLSSDRMRDAEWIFAAIRRGQDLGDILGYRFERTLKDDLKAAHWIYPIRQAVLVLTGQKIDPEQPGVDGLELIRLYTTGKAKSLQTRAEGTLRSLGGADKLKTWDAAKEALERLVALNDALADAAIADSVHALVQGNLLRSGASLSAISDGEVPPPELDMLSTAPTAQTQTHRVALIAPDSGEAPTPWVSEPEAYPGLLADPDAEAIAAALMGPPDQLVVPVEYMDKSGNIVGEAEVNWAEMLRNHSPFALPAFQTLMTLPADGFGEGSDLVRRLLAHATTFPPRGTEPGATARLALRARDRDALSDVMDRWLGWRAVILDARPMGPRDIVMEDDDEGIRMDIEGLEVRAKEARKGFLRLANDLLQSLPEPIDGDEKPIGKARPAELLRLFDDLARMGATYAVFRGTTDVIDGEAIWAHAWSIAPKLRKTRKELRALTLPTGRDQKGNPKSADIDPGVRLKAARTMLRAVFGQKFKGLARLASANIEPIAASVSQSAKRDAKFQGTTAAQWIEKLGYVRPAMRAMNDALLVQDCQIGAPGGVSLAVGQWPEDGLQPWIAVGAPKGETPPKSSIVAAMVPGASMKGVKELTGLVVDEVVDRVPSTEVNTGAALHFDSPNTEAPQTFLLAMPPEGESWSYAVMMDTVRDAFQLAKMRAVDGHMTSHLNQLMPAIYASKSTLWGAK